MERIGRLAAAAEAVEEAIMHPSLSSWLSEQEHKRHSPVFLCEWLATFALAWLFWLLLFHKLEISARATAGAAAIAALYASVFVYLRLFPVTRCAKCRSPLPLIREEVGRRRVRDEELALEVERGGEEYWGHFIDLYQRIYGVDIVRFRCTRCGAVWESVEHVPVSDYRLVRTIRVKD